MQFTALMEAIANGKVLAHASMSLSCFGGPTQYRGQEVLMLRLIGGCVFVRVCPCVLTRPEVISHA